MRIAPPLAMLMRRQRMRPAGWQAPPLGLVMSICVIGPTPMTRPRPEKITVLAATPGGTPLMAATAALGEPSVPLRFSMMMRSVGAATADGSDGATSHLPVGSLTLTIQFVALSFGTQAEVSVSTN